MLFEDRSLKKWSTFQEQTAPQGSHHNLCVYVVVPFYPWFNFYFLLFLGMVMYDNEINTKEDKN